MRAPLTTVAYLMLTLRSSGTSGEAFSLMVRDALVCWMKRLAMPTSKLCSSCTSLTMCLVTMWHPLLMLGSEMVFWILQTAVGV